LQPFQFEVVTVDNRGRETGRNYSQAYCFVEALLSSEDVPDTSGAVLDMVAIPSGKFLMGLSEDVGNGDRHPSQQVTIAPFFLGKYPVTQAQWRIVAALPAVKLELVADPSAFKGDALPVENVSWVEAAEFCARLSQQTGCTYRLPTEAEWEYACRAGTTTPFHFGETITPNLANYDGNFIYGYGPRGKYRRQTTPVGCFGVANAFGLYDMHGNVWEWCASPKPPLPSTEASTDWSAGVDQTDYLPRLRGGSWDDLPWFCRSTNLCGLAPDNKMSLIGFRVACSAKSLGAIQ
jgi:formylglycine-generating enzyme required for sulfatase activity